MIATVFLPLSFLTGFFGQNFGWLVDHTESLAAFVLFGLGGLGAALAGLYLWLRHGGRVPRRPSWAARPGVAEPGRRAS